MIKSPQSLSFIHRDFKLNDQVMTKESLIDTARTYSNTKQPNLKDLGSFLLAWFDDQAMIAVQTSGSTGTPKKLWVKKQYMINSAVATGRFFNLPAKTSALLCMPTSYIAGKLMVVRALILGWHLDHVTPQANPFSVYKKTYDFSAITPYQLEYSLSDLSRVKKLIVGGGAIPRVLKEKVQTVSTEIYETFGMTETLTHIAARPINTSTSREELPFKVLEGVTIEQDKRHCLVIKAPRVSDDIIFTNDRVELKNKTTFYLLGRADNIINSGGIKIQPEEIEQRLDPLISSRFFITGIPDKTLGKKVVLIVEDKRTKAKEIALSQAIDHLADLHRYKKPKAIYYCSEFEETHSGKVNRKKTAQKTFAQL